MTVYGPRFPEVVDRILERPQRVPGIEVHADVVPAGRLDQPGQLRRVHVARMVLDGDLDAGVECLRSLPAAAPPSRLSMWRSMPPSVSRSSQVPRTTRITGEPSDFRRADAERQVLVGRAAIRLERLRRRADAPRAHLHVHSLALRALPNSTAGSVVERLEGVEVGDEQRVAAERGGVVHQLRRLPAEAAHGEIVEAKPVTLFSSRETRAVLQLVMRPVPPRPPQCGR